MPPTSHSLTKTSGIRSLKAASISESVLAKRIKRKPSFRRIILTLSWTPRSGSIKRTSTLLKSNLFVHPTFPSKVPTSEISKKLYYHL